MCKKIVLFYKKVLTDKILDEIKRKNRIYGKSVLDPLI